MSKRERTFKNIPAFQSEEAEREFWAHADSADYIDWSKAETVRFPNLRPSSTPISIRLPDTLLAELKLLANERDVPYQSLLKMYLADRVTFERDRKRQRSRRLDTQARQLAVPDDFDAPLPDDVLGEFES